MNLKSSLVLSLFFAALSFTQIQPQIQVPLKISDMVQTRVLKLGIDPSASDSIDAQLGEEGLPPWPFGLEARFVLPIGNFSGFESYQDYRNGSAPYTGLKEHRLKYQKGQTDTLKILYDLPPEITIDVQDLFGGIVVNTRFFGNGSFIIPNPDALNQLKLLVNYNNAPSDIKLESNIVPNNISLKQNYPNPFNPNTKISFSIKEHSNVSLEVFDLLGRVITIIVDDELQSGSYSVDFNASQFPSGVYFYRLSVNGNIISKKMILEK